MFKFDDPNPRIFLPAAVAVGQLLIRYVAQLLALRDAVFIALRIWEQNSIFHPPLVPLDPAEKAFHDLGSPSCSYIEAPRKMMNTATNSRVVSAPIQANPQSVQNSHVGIASVVIMDF